MPFTPTAEQTVALDLFEKGASLAIQAGAGTGKTSTLQLLANSNRRRENGTLLRGQYIAFNKAIVTEAGAKMPSTVACNTAHSLAFKAVGYRYKDRLNGPRVKSLDIARQLRIDGMWVTRQDDARKQLSASYLAGLVMRSIVKFCQTADPEPTRKHVPYIDGIDLPPGTYENNRQVAAHIEPAIKAAWADIQDERGSLPFRHDHYLKMWQLSNPRIGADYVMFDEAQDANPVMVAVVAAQTHAQLVWVGDSQQQIYSFTGAVNALDNVPADNRAFLTKSFRFGPAIADIANRCLTALNAELRLEGTDTIESTVGDADRPDCILTRTNAESVRHVLNAKRTGRRAHLVGGGTEVVSFAKAAAALMGGGRTEHPELACFDSWGEVQDYVDQDAQGAELKLLVGLIDEFGVDTIIDALDRMPREDHADVTISTAHKAKGREWNVVQLGGDFPEMPQDEEMRLLYVAVTRARFRLDVGAAAWFALGPDANAVAPGPRDEPDTPEPAQAGHDAARDFAEHRSMTLEQAAAAIERQTPRRRTGVQVFEDEA